jgi:hypothetical protein
MALRQVQGVPDPEPTPPQATCWGWVRGLALRSSTAFPRKYRYFPLGQAGGEEESNLPAHGFSNDKQKAPLFAQGSHKHLLIELQEPFLQKDLLRTATPKIVRSAAFGFWLSLSGL